MQEQLEQSINFEDTADMTKLRIVGYTHKIYSQILNIDLSTDYFYYDPVMNLNKEIQQGQDANNDLKVNKPGYNDYQHDKDKVTDIIDNGIDTGKTGIHIGGYGVMERRGYYMGQIRNDKKGRMKILDDKIIFSQNGTFTDYVTAISSAGIYAKILYGELIAGEKLYISNENGTFEITPEGARITNLNLSLINSDNPKKATKKVVITNNSFIMSKQKLDDNNRPVFDSSGYPVFTPVFELDQNGNVVMNDLIANNALIQGVFQTGFAGTDRIIIDGTGMQSYNSNNQKHGLNVNPKNSNLTLFFHGNEVFNIFNGIDGYTSISSFGNLFLNFNSYWAEAYNKWIFTQRPFIKEAGQEYPVATTKNVDDLQHYLEGMIDDLQRQINNLQPPTVAD